MSMKLSGDVARAGIDRFENPDHFNINFVNQNAIMSLMSWQEYALTYARVIFEHKYQRLRLGGTVKLLLGNGSAFFNGRNINLLINNERQLITSDFNVSYGYSDNFQSAIDGVGTNYQWKRATDPQIGYDLGLSFEKRRSFGPWDRKMRLHGKNRDPYDYKLNIAILDMGNLRHNYGASSASTRAVIDPAQVIDIDNRFGSTRSLTDFYDSLTTIATLQRLDGSYTMGLPTRLEANLDFPIDRNVYLNWNALISLRSLKFSDYSTNYISSLTVTPRWEVDGLGAYLPVYLNVKGRVNVGASFRIGPLIVGTYDILPFLTRKEVYSQGVFVMFKSLFRPIKQKNPLKCIDLGWRNQKISGKQIVQ